MCLRHVVVLVRTRRWQSAVPLLQTQQELRREVGVLRGTQQRRSAVGGDCVRVGAVVEKESHHGRAVLVAGRHEGRLARFVWARVNVDAAHRGAVGLLPCCHGRKRCGAASPRSQRPGLGRRWGRRGVVRAHQCGPPFYMLCKGRDKASIFGQVHRCLLAGMTSFDSGSPMEVETTSASAKAWRFCRLLAPCFFHFNFPWPHDHV